MVGSTSATGTQCVLELLQVLVPCNHIEFQTSSNVKFALNAATTLEPTE